jgi:PhzF family phenazine biosynthesis protein
MQSIIQVDAFTDRAFAGNPAAVCLLEKPADDAWMQNVAREMNLSETAFMIPRDDAAHFGLRWFTPTVEVELCGHATLASAHVLFEGGHVPRTDTIHFSTLSGTLLARSSAKAIVLDFPSDPPVDTELPDGLMQALGAYPVHLERGSFDYLVELESEAAVRSLQPDFAALRQLPVRGVIATARSESPEFDFVSRCFAPGVGIDEDPVTGSAHCTLAPYWGAKLGKTRMTGFQASNRGGAVGVELKGDRVELTGKAVTVLRGELLA